jgi:hypothetical protein
VIAIGLVSVVAWGWVAVVGLPADAEKMVADMVAVVMGSSMLVGFAVYAGVVLARQRSPKFRELSKSEQARRHEAAEQLRRIDRPTTSHD